MKKRVVEFVCFLILLFVLLLNTIPLVFSYTATTIQIGDRCPSGAPGTCGLVPETTPSHYPVDEMLMLTIIDEVRFDSPLPTWNCWRDSHNPEWIGVNPFLCPPNGEMGVGITNTDIAGPYGRSYYLTSQDIEFDINDYAKTVKIYSDSTVGIKGGAKSAGDYTPEYLPFSAKYKIGVKDLWGSFGWKYTSYSQTKTCTATGLDVDNHCTLSFSQQIKSVADYNFRVARYPISPGNPKSGMDQVKMRVRASVNAWQDIYFSYQVHWSGISKGPGATNVHFYWVRRDTPPNPSVNICPANAGDDCNSGRIDKDTNLIKCVFSVNDAEGDAVVNSITWRLDGVTIPGATTNQLSLFNLNLDYNYPHTIECFYTATPSLPSRQIAVTQADDVFIPGTLKNCNTIGAYCRNSCPLGEILDSSDPICQPGDGSVLKCCIQNPENICTTHIASCETSCLAGTYQDTVDPTCNLVSNGECCIPNGIDSCITLGASCETSCLTGTYQDTVDPTCNLVSNGECCIDNPIDLCTTPDASCETSCTPGRNHRDIAGDPTCNLVSNGECCLPGPISCGDNICNDYDTCMNCNRDCGQCLLWPMDDDEAELTAASVTDCRNIYTGGNYILSNDITYGGLSVCMILLNNIQFEGNRFTITGTDKHGIGLWNIGTSGSNYIRNIAKITNFNTGINFNPGTSAVIRRIEIISNTYGLWLFNVNHVNLGGIKSCDNDDKDLKCLDTSGTADIIGIGNTFEKVISSCGTWPVLGTNYNYCNYCEIEGEGPSVINFNPSSTFDITESLKCYNFEDTQISCPQDTAQTRYSVISSNNAVAKIIDRTVHFPSPFSYNLKIKGLSNGEETISTNTNWDIAYYSGCDKDINVMGWIEPDCETGTELCDNDIDDDCDGDIDESPCIPENGPGCAVVAPASAVIGSDTNMEVRCYLHAQNMPCSVFTITDAENYRIYIPEDNKLNGGPNPGSIPLPTFNSPINFFVSWSLTYNEQPITDTRNHQIEAKFFDDGGNLKVTCVPDTIQVTTGTTSEIQFCNDLTTQGQSICENDNSWTSTILENLQALGPMYDQLGNEYNCGDSVEIGDTVCTFNFNCGCQWDSTSSNCENRRWNEIQGGTECELPLDDPLNDLLGQCISNVENSRIGECASSSDPYEISWTADWFESDGSGGFSTIPSSPPENVVCENGDKTFPCPSKSAVPFFTFFNLIISCLVIVGVYLTCFRFRRK